MIISNLALVVRGAEVFLFCLFVFAVIKILKLAAETTNQQKMPTFEAQPGSSNNDKPEKSEAVSKQSTPLKRKTGPAEIHAFRFISAQFERLKGHPSIASDSDARREACLSYFVSALNFIAIHYEYKSDDRFQLIRNTLQAHGEQLGLVKDDSKGLAEAIKSVLNKEHKQFTQAGGLAVKEWILYDKMTPSLSLAQLLYPVAKTEKSSEETDTAIMRVTAKAS